MKWQLWSAPLLIVAVYMWLFQRQSRKEKLNLRFYGRYTTIIITLPKEQTYLSGKLASTLLISGGRNFFCLWRSQLYINHCTHVNKKDNFEHIQLEAGLDCAASIPGRAVASFRNRALILNPAFALVSIKVMFSLVALSSPSSTETCRRSEASVLLPTSAIMTSFPRSLRTSSIHFEVFKNEARSTHHYKRGHTL